MILRAVKSWLENARGRCEVIISTATGRSPSRIGRTTIDRFPDWRTNAWSTRGSVRASVTSAASRSRITHPTIEFSSGTVRPIHWERFPRAIRVV